MEGRKSKMDFKTKEKIIVGTDIDFKIEEEVKERVQQAIKVVVDECSKEYLRNIKVSLTVDIK